jgi:hypothetical protein
MTPTAGVTDELPRTAVEKIDRRVLVEIVATSP